MTNSRTLGFDAYQSTRSSFFDVFDELRARRIIPADLRRQNMHYVVHCLDHDGAVDEAAGELRRAQGLSGRRDGQDGDLRPAAGR